MTMLDITVGLESPKQEDVSRLINMLDAYGLTVSARKQPLA